jgi:hypothetical protein
VASTAIALGALVVSQRSEISDLRRERALAHSTALSVPHIQHGQPDVPVPSVLGLPLRYATLVLGSVGLNVVADHLAPEYIVQDQDPSPGTNGRYGSIVLLQTHAPPHDPWRNCAPRQTC